MFRFRFQFPRGSVGSSPIIRTKFNVKDVRPVWEVVHPFPAPIEDQRAMRAQPTRDAHADMQSLHLKVQTVQFR